MQALETSQECSSPSCPAVPWRINLHTLFSRIYCPAHCKDEPSYWAPVFGTNVYADVSTNLSPRVLTALSHSWGHTGVPGRNPHSLVVIPCGDGRIGVNDGGRQAWGALLLPSADLFSRIWMCRSTAPRGGFGELFCSPADSSLGIWSCPLTSPSLWAPAVKSLLHLFTFVKHSGIYR